MGIKFLYILFWQLSATFITISTTVDLFMYISLCQHIKYSSIVFVGECRTFRYDIMVTTKCEDYFWRIEWETWGFIYIGFKLRAIFTMMLILINSLD